MNKCAFKKLSHLLQSTRKKKKETKKQLPFCKEHKGKCICVGGYSKLFYLVKNDLKEVSGEIPYRLSSAEWSALKALSLTHTQSICVTNTIKDTIKDKEDTDLERIVCGVGGRKGRGENDEILCQLNK